MLGAFGGHQFFGGDGFCGGQFLLGFRLNLPFALGAQFQIFLLGQLLAVNGNGRLFRNPRFSLGDEFGVGIARQSGHSQHGQVVAQFGQGAVDLGERLSRQRLPVGDDLGEFHLCRRFDEFRHGHLANRAQQPFGILPNAPRRHFRLVRVELGHRVRPNAKADFVGVQRLDAIIIWPKQGHCKADGFEFNDFGAGVEPVLGRPFSTLAKHLPLGRTAGNVEAMPHGDMHLIGGNPNAATEAK